MLLKWHSKLLNRLIYLRRNKLRLAVRRSIWINDVTTISITITYAVGAITLTKFGGTDEMKFIRKIAGSFAILIGGCRTLVVLLGDY